MTQLLHATAVLAERCTLDPERDLGLGGRFMPETTGGAPLVTLRMRCAEGLRRRMAILRAELCVLFCIYAGSRISKLFVVFLGLYRCAFHLTNIKARRLQPQT